MKAVLLDRDAHRHLRVVTRLSPIYGDNQQTVPVLATELRTLAIDFPMYLMKDTETGAFGLYALLGFEPKENLYITNGGWAATSMPLHLRRQPFIVGRKPSGNDNNGLISIDMESSRVQTFEGERLFTPEGEQTPYLMDIARLLSTIMAGVHTTRSFIESLVALDLIEAVSVSVKLAGGSVRNIAGLYSVNEQALRSLPADELHKLNQQGYLIGVYLLAASAANLQKLINLKTGK